MAVGGVAVSAEVKYRDNFGKFIAECEAAGLKTMNQLADQMETDARNFAPWKTGRLAGTIAGISTGKTAVVTASAPYAMAQESGARPHLISGSPNLSFYWKKKGRRFIPASIMENNPGAVSIVSHPGNPATNYLKRSYQIAMRAAIPTAARYYPG